MNVFLHRLLLAFSCLALSLGVPSMCQSATSAELRDNGTDWIQFGPAIIRSTKRIDLHLKKFGTFRCKKADSTFSQTLDWVRAHFENSLNCSPTNPSYLAQSYGNYIELFAQESGSRDELLLVIPINAKTLNIKPAEVEAELNKAYRLITSSAAK